MGKKFEFIVFVLQMLVNIGCLLSYELINHPIRRGMSIASPRIIQKLIGNSFHLFVTSISVCLYVLMGHLLMIHIKAVRFEGTSTSQINGALDQLQQWIKL